MDQISKALSEFINNHKKEIDGCYWLTLFNAAKTHLNEKENQKLCDMLYGALGDNVLDIAISKYIFTVPQREDYSMTLSEKMLNFLRDNEEYLQNNDIKPVFDRIKQINSNPQKTINARELFHCIVDKVAHYLSNYNFITLDLQSYAKNFKQIKLYTKNTYLLNEISETSGMDCLNSLLSLMEKYHSYIDYYGENEKNLIIFIGETEKTITDDIKLKKYFNIYAKNLYKKATSENATALDLFFLLAYHTIDKIEFKPKEEMTKWVSESHNINGYYHYPIHSKDVDPSAIDESHLSTYGHTPQCKEELLGCYIDRSWQNINLDADNHNIYLCKEYIEEFSEKLSAHTECGEKLYEAILILTLLHEFGHLAFSYLDYTTKYEGDGKATHESRANFFASYMFAGKFDECIEQKVAIQPKEYQKPLLYSKDEWENDTAIKEIYP